MVKKKITTKNDASQTKYDNNHNKIFQGTFVGGDNEKEVFSNHDFVALAYLVEVEEKIYHKRLTELLFYKVFKVHKFTGEES